SPKILTLGLVILGIALLTYKVGPYFVPAIVDNRPLTRFEVWSRLEKSYGKQTLDDLVNEKILDLAIAQSGVSIPQAKIDDQIKTLEKQFEGSGGLDQILSEQGLTRAELTKQVVTQLSVEEILKDEVVPSEEEIAQQFADNKDTLYKDKKLDEVKADITTELTQTKLRDAFLTWFAEVKKTAKVKSFGL
ncbi:MAG: Peptidyl-prolyl cis-trans isomerase, partial [Microgenomates group bacterium GW2011_GWF1_46_12]